jgi:hypothetical protein
LEQFHNLEKKKYHIVGTAPKSREKKYHTVETVPKSREKKILHCWNCSKI